MAQLSNLIVTGASRFLNKVYAKDIEYSGLVGFNTNGNISYFKNTSNQSVGYDDTDANAIGYVPSTNGPLGIDGAIYKQVYSNLWVHEIYGDYRTGQICLRGKNNGTWQAWRTVLDSGNYTSYTVTKTGAGASGTWGISVTGSAASATKVSNSLTIQLNGTSQGAYNGSAAKTINITPSSIGAAASSHTHSYAPTTHSHTKSQISDLGTIGAAASKGVDTVVKSGSANLVTSGAVYTAINEILNGAS